MTRLFDHFSCEGERLACTIDTAKQTTGLLIVSGGNEIRSGAHAGMAKLANIISQKGFPVFRYDRRGIGESSGVNLGFLNTQADIQAAVEQFRKNQSQLTKIIAFGNCDAATALALFGRDIEIDGLILANPWIIEAQTQTNTPTKPPPSAIRARYLARLKNPQTVIDLFKGQVDLRKLLRGLRQATKKQENSDLAIQLRDALVADDKNIRIILAERDATALAFTAAWESQDYSSVRNRSNITLKTINSGSHSFADEQSKAWLLDQIVETLKVA